MIDPQPMDWRAVLTTDEAKQSHAITQRMFYGQEPRPTDAEVGASLKWMAEVGAPALRAMADEAETKGCTVWEL